MNYIKYAFSRYSNWFSAFATIIGVIAIFPLCKPLAILVIIVCVLGAFIIPLLISLIKKDFSIKVIGNSKVSVHFGDLLEEDCFLITTNRNFDVDPDGKFISESSLLGLFVNNFFRDNIDEIKQIVKDNLELDDEGKVKLVPYGKTILFRKNEKTIYLMAFTDRKKSTQPKDFYYKAIKGFLKEVSDANHGKTIAIPLLGNNNNLSNTGFDNSIMSFESLIAIINTYGIENPNAELKIKIVILPNKRSELIRTIANHS